VTLEPESSAVEPLPDQQPLPGMQHLVAWEAHAGPLPPAHELAGYEKVLSGAAERIMKMAESQLEHQIEADKAADKRDNAIVKTEIRLAYLGLLTTFVIVLTFIGLVAFAIWQGRQLLGIGAAIAAVATIIAALNGGQFRSNRSNESDTVPAPPNSAGDGKKLPA